MKSERKKNGGECARLDSGQARRAARYSQEAIYLLERGITSRGQSHPVVDVAAVKLACAGLEHELEIKPKSKMGY